MTGSPNSEPLEEVKNTLGPDVKIAPAHGIAAISLTMAMKFHDINTVQDGTLYQQYKLEGKNLMPLRINDVFETAMKIELHLLASSARIANVVIDAFQPYLDEDETEVSASPDSEP